ncbi:hypothetical protein SPMU_28660 [Sphingomonas mucosissima]|uniref:Uncharacterized protein n=1 Tax=Sphingomonas mucosissima TaxID=370959 RepID=A0A245ZFU7_9SPHN|nr:hypothetical protein SPMU_28660 [Sphingomonas mucosissima]
MPPGRENTTGWFLSGVTTPHCLNLAGSGNTMADHFRGCNRSLNQTEVLDQNTRRSQ